MMMLQTQIFVVVVAGLAKMNLLLFLVCFALGVSIWNVLLLGGGYLLGENWEQILVWIRVYSTVVLSVLTAAVVIYAFVRYRRARQANDGSGGDV